MKPLLLVVMTMLLGARALSGALRTRRPEPLRARGYQIGLASWYGAWHRGRLTASGVPFNEHALTAAHRTLPLGSRVRVTNLRNRRSVVVRIIDRGPTLRRRVIDVSKAAADRLGFTRRGLTPVKVSVISIPRGASAPGPASHASSN